MAKQTTNKNSDTAAAEMPVAIDAEQVDAASVDGENTQTQSASVIDAAQIDFKKLKMRGLPKGLTIEGAKVIIGAVKAVASGKPNNQDKGKPFSGFSVEEFRAYMGDNNYQNAAQYCIIHNYNGRNRNFSAFTYLHDKPYNFICTMNATKLLPELQADKTLSGEQLYGYNSRITKAMRAASEDKKSLIGTLSFNHLVNKNFGVDCAFISRADCNWARKNVSELYTLNENFDVDALPEGTTNIDYRDVHALDEYLIYLRALQLDDNASNAQKTAAQAILKRIGA